MKVYSGNEKKWHVEFVYSPLFEMLCSLHVLINPQHHLERLVWASEMQNQLPQELLKTLGEFDKRTLSWCTIMDLCNMYEPCDDFSIIGALNYIGQLPEDDYKKVYSKYKDEDQKPLNKAEVEAMISALKAYYFTFFERELRFIEPLLVRCLTKAAEQSKAEGLLNYIRKLHNRIEVTSEAFLFHKYTLFTVPFEELQHVIIRVSSFIDPHLLMDYGDSMVQFTLRVHLDQKVEEVPKDLVLLLKALSDETRLKILRSIGRQKATTQSLAMELNITEAGISKHLKLLYDADLLYKERDGNFINYYLNASLLDHIGLKIHEYVEC